MSNDAVADKKQAVDNKFSKYVIPLYAYDDRKTPKVRGTCIIVHHAGDYYLVTARHVVDEKRMAGGVFLLVAPNRLMSVAGISACAANVAGEKNLDDPYDVVVTKLSKNSVFPPYLGVINKFAVEIEWLFPGLVPRSNWPYIMMGFPQSKNKISYVRREMNMKVHAYEGISPKSEQYRALKVEEEGFILIEFNKRGGVGDVPKDGEFPALQGMSGGPIFLSYFDVEEFKKIPVCIVGVITNNFPKEKFVKGTDIGCAVQLIKGLHFK